MRVVILLPWRPDGGWRDKLWAFCRQRWEENFPDWPIYEGLHAEDEGPFNRSLAINRAAQHAEPWDVALIIDGDTVSDPGAIRRAVEHAARTGDLSIAHNARVMLNERGTQQVLGGLEQSAWGKRVHTKTTYYDSVSCAVAVSRETWNLVGGFDERFVGWGFEDTAFRIAVETLTDRAFHQEKSVCYHLWHPASPEASKFAPTYAKNHALKARYERAHYQPERIEAILRREPDPGAQWGVIPHVLWRTVPAETSEEVEQWWNEFSVLHPTWDLRTIREPVNPAEFPLTGHLFDKCANGAQKAGLIRLELLATFGGVYVDSDVQPIRPFDALTWVPAFAAWEDEKVVPDAILGSVPGHPAIRECLRRAIGLIEGGSVDPWETGPGVTTSLLPWRDDVLLLPPGSFYPVHYREKAALGTRNGQPWVFAEHKWHHSWGSEKQKAANARRQRIKPSPQAVELSVEALIPEDLKIGICMPWRDNGDPWRRDAHMWCLDWWQVAGLRVYHGDGVSRAEMCNDAARKALAEGNTVLVFADADTWGPYTQIVAAAIGAASSGKLTHAYDIYARMDSSTTRQGLNTQVKRIRPERYVNRGKRVRGHVSGLSAISRELLLKVGGFDERFIGWGFEDQAFHLACQVMGGGVERIQGPAIHWHHKSDPTKNDEPGPTLIDLMTEYCAAAGEIPGYGRVGRLGNQGVIVIDTSGPNAVRMQTLLSGEGGPLRAPVMVS